MEPAVQERSEVMCRNSRAWRQPVRVAMIVLGLLSTAEAQSPAPRPPRRTPAPRSPVGAASEAAPAKGASASPVASKPLTVLEQVVAVVAAGTPPDPADDVSRKLLLAEVAAEAGDATKSKALLEEVTLVIEPMPKVDPDDKEGKRINFRRSGLRSRWVRAMARLDAARALKSALLYGEETNPLHHASLLDSLLDGLDCSPPERKAAVEENVRMLLKPIKEALGARTWGLVNAPLALRVVARASRLCGLDPTGEEVRTLAARTLKVFEDTDLRIRACGMATAKVHTEVPTERAKAIAGLSRYQLKARSKGEDADKCTTDKLYFASEIAPEIGANDPARSALVDFVATTVAQLDPAELRFGLCSAAQNLAKLTSINPAAAERGVALALAAWRKQDRIESYCDLPAVVATAGRQLAQAGSTPEWLCSPLSARPEGKTLTEADEKTLRQQHTRAAVELRGRCPDADALLQFDRSDVKLLSAVRARQLAVDRVAAEPLVAEDLKALPAGERYAYAVAVLPAFWTKQ
jgi:hypothetical protein